MVRNDVEITPHQGVTYNEKKKETNFELHILILLAAALVEKIRK